MSQIFHRSANTIARVSIFGAVFFVAGLLGLFAEVNRSPWVTDAHVAREQPIQFSHERHVAGNGIDCRYCHTSVEDSSFAGIPPTKTCMNCHSQIFANSPFLEPVRDSFRTGKSIQWTRVHDLPDFVYFNHSIHVNKGVGCTTCHGQVDRMPLMWQEKSLQMEWCLDCHRNPERYVRPREAVFRVDYVAAARSGSSSASGWSPNIRFRSSRAARRAIDERRHGTGAGAGARGARATTLRHQPRAASLSPAARRFWRTLDEQADDPAFQEHLYNEFPSQVEAITDPVARRTFLKLMGASLALAGVTACTKQPAETIVPYVRQPEELIPGKPLFFATAMPLGGVATGLLVESHEGRPTKIEGNPLHPGSLGATDVFAQAAILGLYDPDRSQTLTNLGDIRPWSAFLGAIERRADGAAAAQGRRPPHPHRVGQLADARRADPRSARALPVGELAPVGSGQPRQRARRREARLRRVRRRAVSLRAGRRHPLARRRLPRLRARRRCATRATSRRAGGRKTPSA